MTDGGQHTIRPLHSRHSPQRLCAERRHSKHSNDYTAEIKHGARTNDIHSHRKRECADWTDHVRRSLWCVSLSLFVCGFLDLSLPVSLLSPGAFSLCVRGFIVCVDRRGCDLQRRGRCAYRNQRCRPRHALCFVRILPLQVLCFVFSFVVREASLIVSLLLVRAGTYTAAEVGGSPLTFVHGGNHTTGTVHLAFSTAPATAVTVHATIPAASGVFVVLPTILNQGQVCVYSRLLFLCCLNVHAVVQTALDVALIMFGGATAGSYFVNFTAATGDAAYAGVLPSPAGLPVVVLQAGALLLFFSFLFGFVCACSDQC